MDTHDHIEVSQQLQLPQQLKRAQEALLRSEQLALAGRFAGAVMHEVNNPLEALGNLVYLAKHEVEHPEIVRDYLRMAEEQLLHVQDIARRTLSFYRLGSASAEVDLVDLLDAALRMQEPRMSTKSIELCRTHPERAHVTANGGELLQVFTNLIANSIDALHENGTLHIRIRRSGEHLHVLIADNGCGIPEHQKAHLFEPFATTKTGKGTGFGLWMSKTLVEKHQGRIRHRSSTRQGRKGTAFRISLPVQKAA